jgi:hypothetical protein
MRGRRGRRVRAHVSGCNAGPGQQCHTDSRRGGPQLEPPHYRQSPTRRSTHPDLQARPLRAHLLRSEKGYHTAGVAAGFCGGLRNRHHVCGFTRQARPWWRSRRSAGPDRLGSCLNPCPTG